MFFYTNNIKISIIMGFTTKKYYLRCTTKITCKITVIQLFRLEPLNSLVPTSISLAYPWKWLQQKFNFPGQYLRIPIRFLMSTLPIKPIKSFSGKSYESLHLYQVLWRKLLMSCLLILLQPSQLSWSYLDTAIKPFFT